MAVTLTDPVVIQNAPGSLAYTCSCLEGWTGHNCDQDINECDSDKCQNGATCTNTPGNYTCQCSEYFTGRNCERQTFREWSNTDKLCTRDACSCSPYVCRVWRTAEWRVGILSVPISRAGQISSQRQLRLENNDLAEQGMGWYSAPCIALAPSLTPLLTSPVSSLLMHCVQVLMVTFTQFQLESHASCNYDFLQIHDGATASSEMIGKYCGNDTVRVRVSSCLPLMLMFPKHHSFRNSNFFVIFCSYMSVSLSVCQSISLSVCQSVSLSV